MSTVPTLKEMLADARRAKLSRDYRRAADLYSSAAQTSEAQAEEGRSRFLLRQAAACTYLDTGASKVDRSREALAILEGTDPSSAIDARLELAMALKGELAFGHARALLAEARERIQREWNPSLADQEREARQQHGLCTYKDLDLPPGERLDEALRILDGTDALAVPGVEDLRTTLDPETLGIAGAVHKANWKLDAQRSHLERALWHYLRGYEEGRDDGRQGIAADNGYTAINAAYILDLLASLEQEDLGPNDPSVMDRRKQAREIREKILETLPGVAEESTKGQWWYAATLAEAEFGLGHFEQAGERLERARQASGVEDWEFESTARQLASLLALFPGDGGAAARARQAFARGFGVDPGVAAMLLVGKFGLALSGGGFRASLFHIGVLARLAELDVLRYVEVLSCVSGGSIIGAYYYLELRKLFAKTAPADISRCDYIKIVDTIAREFLTGVQSNVRMRMVGSLVGNLRIIWSKLSRTERIAELFEEKIYARIKDDGARVLKDLTIKPSGWDESGSGPFQPKYHNWRLQAKVPILILNATTLNTGHNWQFTAAFMGESPLAIDPEVDGNNRLRRLYYDAAPNKELREFRLARAVGASACVPVLFEPIALRELYPDKVVRLADGGVHDNQGVVGLLEQDCTVMLVSDASGRVGVEDDPKPSELGVAVRSNDLLMARVRGAQYRDLKARLRARVLRGLMFLHLRKDLDVDHVDWVGCNDPSAVPPRAASTSYGIRKDFQEKVAAIRTDLDCFGEAEAFALMTSGYCMADREFPGCVGRLMAADPGRVDWDFLRIRDLMTEPGTGSPAARDDLLKVLDVGRHQFFRYFHLHPRLMTAARVAAGILVVAALIALLYVWLANPSYRLISAGTAASWLIPVLLGLLGLGWLSKYLFPSQVFFKIVRNLGIALFGWLVALVQLAVFDPWYLRRSRDYRRSLAREASPPNGTGPR